MQENLLTKHTRLMSISIRLGLTLALGILVFLLPTELVTGAALSLPANGWHALPNKGLNLRVRAGVLMGDNLYMGGKFTKTSDGSVTNLGGVARYDTASSTWHALPNQGLSEETIALAVVDNDLYAGGCFTQTVDGAVLNLGIRCSVRYDSRDLARPAQPGPERPPSCVSCGRQQPVRRGAVYPNR